jgi:nitrate reductase delta subunit
MLRSLKSSAADAVALGRVKEWTRARFHLGEDAAILVAQVSCQLPGCAPLETVVAFWSDDQRYRFKVFKPVEEVLADDLPPAWFRDALLDTGDLGCECC